MIIANAMRVLDQARLRRGADECDEIGRTVVSRAAAHMGARFLSVQRTVNNRNSVCFRVSDNTQTYLLKVNKNIGSQAVRDAALRMNSIEAAGPQDEFRVPRSHYIDGEFDAALMDFVPGKRLDLMLAQSSDPDTIRMCLKKAAIVLSRIHALPHDERLAADTDLPKLVREVAGAFPAFSRQNGPHLAQTANLDAGCSVSIHGDYSPKNLILGANGTLFVIDFAAPQDSTSPLRDIAIFAVGMARSLALGRRWRLGGSARRIEALLETFLDEYFAHSPQVAQHSDVLKKQLVLFELVRLAETKVWLDGYRAFDEAIFGWLKSKLGHQFVSSQLRRLQMRIE